MFAIIETGGKQYKVQEGQHIQVEKLEGEDKSEIAINNVLMVADGENIHVGKPYLEGASVITTKVKDDLDKKKIIYKFKRRKDWDKKKGHRQSLTVLKIEKINH